MKTSPAPASERVLPAGAPIVAVRAHPLAPAPARMVLPDWASAALRAPAPPWPENRELFVLEVEAADSALGWYGPCSATTVQILRDQVAPALLGGDPRAHRMVASRGLLGRHTTGAHVRLAVSAARLAVLDLASRQADTAVCALLGGPTRSRVPAYASALGVDIDHPLAGEVAAWLVEQGFHGQKWALPGASRGEEPAADQARLARLREATGPHTRLMVDALGRWSVDYAIRLLPALTQLGVAWLEEPFDGARTAEVARLRGSGGGVPIAAGEHAYDRSAQLELLVGRQVDVWQPDVGWHGGLVDALAMVDVADGYGVRVFPHGGCLAGAVALAGLTHAEVLPAVEYHLTQEPIRQQVLTEPTVPQAGTLPIRSTPGIVDGYRIAPAAPAVPLTGGHHGLG